MNFQKFLADMQEKPDHKKKQFAFWTSFGFTALLFVFWVTTFDSGLNTQNSAVAKSVEKAGTPTQSLTASVGSVFSSVKDFFIKPKVAENISIEVLPGN